MVLTYCLVWWGCGCGWRSQKEIELTDLILQLADRDFISRLDVPDTDFMASTDPTGGNNDFNHYLRLGPPGWWVLADLKGPGYVSRFWFTGGEPPHRIRLFFDNEKAPRIDTSISEFCGGMDPFRQPLAAYENYCYYNYVPLTYRKRLVIMVEAGATREGGWPRLFFQINATPLPSGCTVKSFRRPLSPPALEALEKVAECWWRPGDVETLSDRPLTATTAEAQALPGAVCRLPSIAGPAILREVRIAPDFAALPDAIARANIMRDVVLRVYWDGVAEPSVLTPLGDFGGSVWQRVPYQSFFFGMTNNTWFCRFPMPFATAAEFELDNQSEFPFTASVQFLTEKTTALDAAHGYFHAIWNKSTENDIGRPHVVLDTQGCGRFVGCLLGCASFDNTFWLLEGDECMWRDGGTQPFWFGTGLEDYFTGGWYYQNVLARPLHGLLHKTFFRTVQYRVHLPDVINFKQSFRMVFERGPDNASHGAFESLAWYYLDRPRPTGSALPPLAARRPPADAMDQASVMLNLMAFERFGDYAAAREYIDGFLTRYTDFPFAAQLRVRQAAYLECLEGVAAAKAALASFKAQQPEDSPVHLQTRMLLDYFDRPDAALLGMNANMPARVFLDGAVALEGTTPDKLAVALLALSPGRHVLAVQCRFQNYPDWMQLYLKMHSGAVYTTPDWRHAVNPSGVWWELDYDDRQWPEVGGTGCKGPPEEPYLWVEPNAFVDMQSRAIALRPSAPWPSKSGFVVYRRVFQVGPVAE
ncbi:MAG: glycoside hydrolase family 172 protein [Kiritimatiellia bacterium]